MRCYSLYNNHTDYCSTRIRPGLVFVVVVRHTMQFCIPILVSYLERNGLKYKIFGPGLQDAGQKPPLHGRDVGTFTSPILFSSWRPRCRSDGVFLDPRTLNLTFQLYALAGCGGSATNCEGAAPRHLPRCGQRCFAGS